MTWWSELAASVTWPVVTLIVLAVFALPIWRLLAALAKRASTAQSLELAWSGARIALMQKELPFVGPDAPALTSTARLRVRTVSASMKAEYNKIGADRRGIHLVHTIAPSEELGQRFQVFLYLVPHRRVIHGHPADLSDVRRAEFYLGTHWRDQVFVAEQTWRRSRRRASIGLTTHAYGPFLCLCSVTLRDGSHAVLHRYVDFEAGKTLTGGQRFGEPSAN